MLQQTRLAKLQNTRSIYMLEKNKNGKINFIYSSIQNKIFINKFNKGNSKPVLCKLKHYWKKKYVMNGKSLCSHGSEDLIPLRW